MLETPYPYLWASLFAVIVALILITLQRNFRIPILLSGMTCVSNAWCVFTLEDVYWSPMRLGGQAIGIEDFLMGFSAGVITMSIAISLNQLNGTVLTWQKKTIPLRISMGVLLGISLFLGLWWLGIPAMALYLSVMLFSILIFLLWRPSLWPLALTGGLGFPLIWMLLAMVSFWAWPDFIHQWNATTLWGGNLILGVPIGELFWAILFGASCPLFIAFVIDVRFSQADKSISN